MNEAMEAFLGQFGKSEDGGQMPEDGGQMSDVRCQRTEDGGRPHADQVG